MLSAGVATSKPSEYDYACMKTSVEMLHLFFLTKLRLYLRAHMYRGTDQVKQHHFWKGKAEKGGVSAHVQQRFQKHGRLCCREYMPIGMCIVATKSS